MNSSNILNLSQLPANVRQQLIDYYLYLVDKYASVEQKQNQDTAFLNQFAKPIRKQTDVEALVREQNYKGVDKAKIKSITQTIDIPQSTDELLLLL